MKSTRRAAVAALASLALAPFVHAQTPYPSKVIRLIVPFPAGGGGDTLARLMMTRVAQELGQPLVVENLAGAGGNIGGQTASRATPDGYTLFYGTNGTHGINQSLYKNPGFDAVKDFEPISRLSRIAALVVVRPGLPVNSMPELIAQLKANPGKFTFASAGNGTTSHLAGEILKSQAKLSAVHIPYRGGAAAITDVMGDRVDFMIDVMPNTAPQVRSGRLRGLAVSTAQRVGSFPEVPTIAQSGLPGFDVSAWDAIFAPAGTPRAVIDRVNAAIKTALADEGLKQQLVQRGAEAAPSTPEDLREFVKAEITRWGDAVKASGASVD